MTVTFVNRKLHPALLCTLVRVEEPQLKQLWNRPNHPDAAAILSSWREHKKKAKHLHRGHRAKNLKLQEVWRFCVAIENQESGYDLSFPLMSRPEDSRKSKVSLKTETSCETMTSGFDLSWPLISQRPEHQVEGVRIKKAA